jgi:hypothetical protein
MFLIKLSGVVDHSETGQICLVFIMVIQIRTKGYKNWTNWSGFRMPSEYQTIRQPNWSGVQIMTVLNNQLLNAQVWNKR